MITETVTLSPSQSVGPSKRGPRNIIPITGGELTGASPASPARRRGLSESSPPATIDARYLWQTADGEIIIVRNGGAFGSLVPTFEVRGQPLCVAQHRHLPELQSGDASGWAVTFFESAR